jgi:YVTN family beta-propeller protein
MTRFTAESTLRAWALAAALATFTVAGAVASSVSASTPATPSPASVPQAKKLARTVEIEGLRIEAEITPLDPDRQPGEYREGDAVNVTFRISDTTTDTPLPGLFPAAWMDLIPDSAQEGPDSCQEKIEGYVGGTLLAVPEVDLNVYYVLALNEEATISVVDPLFGFGGSKLLSMVFLRSPGFDWVANSDDTLVFVSMPDSGRVAVVDTASWKVIHEIETGGRPSRLAIQPDGRYLWVGDAGGPGVSKSAAAIVDLQKMEILARVTAGAAGHHLAFSADSRYAYILSEQAGTLSVFDIPSLKPVVRLNIGPLPVSMAYSDVADTLYISEADAGVIVVIDGREHTELTRIPAQIGISELKIAPGGRLGFAVNPQTDEVYIFDTSLNRIIQTGDVLKAPAHIAFTDELAYIQHRGSELVLMIPLKQVGVPGAPVPTIDFSGGQQPFGVLAHPTAAASIVQAPGATAVLVANPSDKMIYFYKEGMAAPMGSFSNYDRIPRAVTVIDRSLSERGATGSYSTAVQLRRPGRYDLAFFLDAPRLTQCFEFEVEANPELERQRQAALGAHVEFLHEGGKVTVGEEVTVQFRLTHPLSGEPLVAKDVQVLTFLVPGTWQKRHAAVSLGDGLYEVAFVPQQEGIYRVLVQALSLKLVLNKSPSLGLEAIASGSEAPASTAGAQTLPHQALKPSSHDTTLRDKI